MSSPSHPTAVRVPISGDSFTARSVSLSQVRVDGPDTLGRGHPRARADARRCCAGVVRGNGRGPASHRGSHLPDVPGTRVHEYGGKAYAVHHGVIVFSIKPTAVSPPLIRPIPLRTFVRPLTTLSKVRYGDFWIAVCASSCAGSRGPLCLGRAVNKIVAIPLDGSAARDDSAITTVFEGTDFAQAPWSRRHQDCPDHLEPPEHAVDITRSCAVASPDLRGFASIRRICPGGSLGVLRLTSRCRRRSHPRG